MGLEELQKRKEELELKRDIARLERYERYSAATRDLAAKFDWNMLWMIPLTGFCVFLIIAAIHDDWPLGLVIGGVPLLITLPCWRRVIQRWRQI